MTERVLETTVSKYGKSFFPSPSLFLTLSLSYEIPENLKLMG